MWCSRYTVHYPCEHKNFGRVSTGASTRVSAVCRQIFIIIKCLLNSLFILVVAGYQGIPTGVSLPSYYTDVYSGTLDLGLDIRP